MDIELLTAVINQYPLLSMEEAEDVMRTVLRVAENREEAFALIRNNSFYWLRQERNGYSRR